MSGAPHRWRLLTADGVGAARGLATDEALMADHARGHVSPPALRLYTYRDHSALCGRYQHLQAEIDLDACTRTGTDVNRRPTGGGAIVMGAGQLGVAVVAPAPAARHPKELLEGLSRGIVVGLAKLGLDAVFAGKNDLKVDGRKIAGLGVYLDGHGGLLFHSSVLADLDIGFMLDVLDTPASKLGAAGIDAVAERVTTVTRETGERWTGESLREVIALGFADELDVELVDSELTAAEHDRAGELVSSRYETDDWRFQRTPRSDATASAVMRTTDGLVRLYLSLSGDTIKSALFTGDFNALPPDLADFEAGLKWTRASPEHLQKLAARTCAPTTALGVTRDQLVTTVLEAAAEAAQRTVSAPEIEGSCYFPDQGDSP